jgi:hypothetical protein
MAFDNVITDGPGRGAAELAQLFKGTQALSIKTPFVRGEVIFVVLEPANPPYFAVVEFENTKKKAYPIPSNQPLAPGDTFRFKPKAEWE